MNKGLLIRILICVFACSGYIYAYINKQNELTGLKMQIPKLAKQLQRIEEENTRLIFCVENFESPANLMKLVRQEEYSHLKFPTRKQILSFPEGLALTKDHYQTEDQSTRVRVISSISAPIQKHE